MSRRGGPTIVVKRFQAVRDRLGGRPTRIIRHRWRPTAVLPGVVALIAGIAASLLRALL